MEPSYWSVAGILSTELEESNRKLKQAAGPLENWSVENVLVILTTRALSPLLNRYGLEPVS